MLLNIIKPFYYIIGHYGQFCIGFYSYKGLTNRGLDGILHARCEVLYANEYRSVRFEGLDGPFKIRWDYDGPLISAQFSIILHFPPPKPYIKNISKIYLWITCG